MILDADTLAAAVRTVMPATRGASHLPALKGVHLSALDGQLTVLATDLDLAIATGIEAEGDLMAVVPAALLAGWLEGRSGEVDLSTADGDLLLYSDTGTMKLRSLLIEDYPRVDVALGEMVKVTDAERRKLLGICYAASRDGARPILNGVGIGDGWACCTDSYRLAATRIEGLPEAVIPVRMLELALKAEGDITLVADDRRVTITNGATHYTVRLIEGMFPNWQRLAARPALAVIIDREATLEALGRVMVLAEYAETPVVVSPDGDGLTFTIVSRDVGEVVERVAGGTELGGKYGFRPRLLGDLLRSRKEAKVEVGVTDALHPVSVGSLDTGEVELVMPVRI